MEVCDKDIDPHVELVAVQQQRVDNVLLDDDVVCVVELREVVDDFYASSSRFADGLHDPIVQIAVDYLFFVEFNAELREFLGQVVGQRQEVEGDPEHLPERV